MSRIAENFDKRAALVKKSVVAHDAATKSGNATVPEATLSHAAIKENILLDLPEAVRQLNSLRAGGNTRPALDLSFGDFVKEKFGFAPSENGSAESLYHALGISASRDTIESLMTMPDFNSQYRWLVPEIIREAVRLGLRRPSIYPNLIQGEETVSQLKVTMPHINMSDATPKLLAEAETIPTGNVSFGQKDVKLSKMGIGLKITDEVEKFVPLNILSIFLQDVGVKLGLGLDTLAINTLINGEQAGESAAVVGVQSTVAGIAYEDILRAWLRMGRLGRLPNAMLGNEEPAIKVLQLPEFKGFAGDSTTQKIQIKTPVPQSQDFYVHGAMPAANRLMLVDKMSAMIKLNAAALSVESERIVERQINGTYVTLMTGFATLFRDARLVLDGTLDFNAGNGFPSWMDVAAAENVILQ